MTELKLFSAALIASAMLTGAASAATVDFSGPTGQAMVAGPYDFGSTTVEVEADRFNRTSTSPFLVELVGDQDALVTVNQEGLGVRNRRFDNFDVDGRFGNDVLLFSFADQIELTDIYFDNVDRNDQFVFFAVDTMADLGGSIAATFFDITDLYSDEGIFSFTPAVAGSIFGIGALQSNDNFRVEGFAGSVVPLPASALLMLSALGGLVLVGRRRSSAA